MFCLCTLSRTELVEREIRRLSIKSRPTPIGHGKVWCASAGLWFNLVGYLEVVIGMGAMFRNINAYELFFLCYPQSDG